MIVTQNYNLMSLVKFLMVSLFFEFYIYIYGSQIESMEVILFTKLGRLAAAVLTGIMVFVLSLAHYNANTVDVSSLRWVGYWVIASLVSVFGAFIGQYTGFKFAGNQTQD